MPKRTEYLVFATLLAGVPFAALPDRAAGADECRAPNHHASEGGHWYYRVDRNNHRKCWYLARPIVAAAPVESPATPSSPMQQLLESLRAKDQTQSAHNHVLRLRSRTTESPVLDATPAATKPRHPNRRPAARGVDGPLSQAKRDELFKEFLRWEEQRKDQAKRDELFREFLRWQVEQRLPTTGTVATENADLQ